MVCNGSGFTDPKSTVGWGIVDFDWSNAKGLWARAKPMDCAELLLQQVAMTHSASSNTKIFVYRNRIKALPWFTTVRETLTDPAYTKWFLPFGANSKPYHVPQCDNNYKPPLCSNYYHDQEQTPGYPHGDGDCTVPACDVGSVPVGEYLWDHRAWNVSVNGKTFGNWFINDYIFDQNGGADPRVWGFFFDDEWTPSGPTELDSNCVKDMGLTSQDVQQLFNAYNSNMIEVYKEIISRGKFSWQQFIPGDATCVYPIVQKSSCATTLRQYCQPKNIAQTSYIIYGFSPGGCGGQPSVMPDFQQDLTNFLLIRGPYAALGHGWKGCSQKYVVPDALNLDYGVPTEICHETSNGVFQRKWTKSTVQMDCNTWTGTIKM